MNCPTERSVIRSIEKMLSTDCIAYRIRVRLDSFLSGCLRTIRLGLGLKTAVLRPVSLVCNTSKSSLLSGVCLCS